VIIDRSPKGQQEQIASLQEHEISSERVEADLRQASLQIDSRTDHFIESDPGHEDWWMIVAHRP
jgi:hypothetical protein